MSTIAIDRGPFLVGSAGRGAGRAPGRGVRGDRGARADVARDDRRPTRAAAARPTARVEARPAGLRLTRRGRWTLSLLAMVVASGAILSAQSAQADAPGAAVPVATHTVEAGETLWSVALSLTAPGEDVRDVVDHLTALNGLSGSTIHAGQLLLVPLD